MSRHSTDVDAVLAGLDDAVPEGHRSGIVAIVGRPNVGKSTLLNALVGEKVAITTDVAGTTRTVIRGILTRDDAQVMLVDTPGLAKPRTLMASRLNDTVNDTLSGVDLVVFLLDGDSGVGDGDQVLASQLVNLSVPAIAVVTKEDALKDKNELIVELERAERAGTWAEILPVSAMTGMNVDVLADLIVKHLPEGPRLVAPNRVTDQSEEALVAELVREQFLHVLHDELPHSIFVEVTEITPRDNKKLVDVFVEIHVERDSQKGIVIGKGGAVLRDASTKARAELERVLGSKVNLQTHVKVTKNWQTDPRALRRFGL